MKLYITKEGAIAHACSNIWPYKIYFHSGYKLVNGKIKCYLEKCDIELPSILYVDPIFVLSNGFYLGAEFYTITDDFLAHATIIDI